MGYLKDKYTRAYAIGKRGNKKLPYGMQGFEEWGRGLIRPEAKFVLDQINFEDKNILCVGSGRGEELKYIFEHKALSITGVEFSGPIYNLCKRYLKEHCIESHVVNEDFLDYAQNLPENVKYHYIIMLDVLEHIPRDEAKISLQSIRKNLLPNGIIFLHLPLYEVDNDVIKEGLNYRAADTSDKYPETQGMHCNRYTWESLINFMQECGYKNISTDTLIAFNKIVKD